MDTQREPENNRETLRQKLRDREREPRRGCREKGQWGSSNRKRNTPV